MSVSEIMNRVHYKNRIVYAGLSLLKKLFSNITNYLSIILKTTRWTLNSDWEMWRKKYERLKFVLSDKGQILCLNVDGKTRKPLNCHLYLSCSCEENAKCM